MPTHVYIRRNAKVVANAKLKLKTYQTLSFLIKKLCMVLYEKIQIPECAETFST